MSATSRAVPLAASRIVRSLSARRPPLTPAIASERTTTPKPGMETPVTYLGVSPSVHATNAGTIPMSRPGYSPSNTRPGARNRPWDSQTGGRQIRVGERVRSYRVGRAGSTAKVGALRADWRVTPSGACRTVYAHPTGGVA